MTRVELTIRQAQVAERVARGVPYKRIAAELGVSIKTVDFHVQQAAARIPGNEPIRQKFSLFFFPPLDDDAAA